MSDELDPKDKALLEDIDAFNRAYAAAGWHIRDKVVREDLSRISLNRSLTSVQFLHVNWQSAVLTDSRFDNVEFQQAAFTGATLHNVVFTDCKLVMCSFQKAKLTDCRFINCVAQGLNARDAVFEGCVFESFEDRSGVFGSAALRNCRFDRGRFDNTSFHSTELHAVLMKESSLVNVIFAAIRGTGLAFEGAALHNCGFEQSQYGSVTFERTNSKGVTFKGFEAENLSLRNCPMIDALTVRGSTWTAPSIQDCPAISELTIGQSWMKDLTLTRSLIAYFRIEEAQVTGDSRITDCRIVGLNLKKSTLVGTQMANCALTAYLILDDATLDALVLSGITYARGLRISSQGVKYLNGSAEFGAK